MRQASKRESGCTSKKRIPLAAGLGGGSGTCCYHADRSERAFWLRFAPEDNLRACRISWFRRPLFSAGTPALATGRGEQIQPLDFFPALRGRAFLLVHPGFGIASAWAYQQLKRFPNATNGRRGRAEKLIVLLHGNDLRAAGAEFYNSLEAPALEKYPYLRSFSSSFAKMAPRRH
jgi:4-diphosphocytidyl-2-C-methyl-D-erythritol kinase